MQSQADEKRLVTADEAAQALGFSIETLKSARIHRKASNPLRDLPFVRIGRNVRYRKVDIDAFIEDHIVDPRRGVA